MSEHESGRQARLVLKLDAAVTECRAGRSSKIQSLQSSAQFLGDIAAFLDREAGKRPPLPARPDLLEMAVLTILAQVYGEAMLTQPVLGRVLRNVAQDGGVVFMQRVLWGETTEDLQQSFVLASAHRGLTQVATLFSASLLAQANEVLARFSIDLSGDTPNESPQ